jgi:phosphoribosylanthranilate isomerase
MVETELDISTIRAFRAHNGLFEELDKWQPRRFILDAYVAGLEGGTGKQVDRKTAKKASAWGEMILAGGLTPDNVEQIISETSPSGVDVASGVEISAGVQSHLAIREFIRAAKLG